MNDPLLLRPAGHKFFKRAFRAIENHPYKKEMNYLHAAVLVKGGRILSVGINKPSQNSYVRRFGPYDHVTLHSELDAILQVRKKIDLTGCKMYVARLFKKNGEPAISRPCEWCQETLKKFGIKKVYYTSWDGSIEVENVNHWN